MENPKHKISPINTPNNFDRFFSKARGVKLFLEEKSDMLKNIEDGSVTTVQAAPIDKTKAKKKATVKK